MYRTIVRDVCMILTASGKGCPPLASCCVEHGTLGFGRVYLCALYWKGGNCRVSLGVGMLHFESDVVWWSDVLLLGFVGLVFLCYFGSDKPDKYREAWGEDLVFWGVSGSRCTKCYQDYFGGFM